MTTTTHRSGTGAALAALTAMLATLGLLLPPPAGAQGWFDADWLYRRAVAVANPAATPLSDYQLRITLDASFDYSHANGDGSDLRVTAGDGTTLLPHWLETWDPGGSQALLWVRVPTIPIEGTTLYLYCGNAAAAPASNGSTTFPLFDDSLWTTTSAGNPVLTAGQPWWEANCTYPIVFVDSSFAERPHYHMLYDGHVVIGHAKGYAWSADLVHWTEYDNGLGGSSRINPIMGVGYTGNAQFAWGDVIRRDDVYHMFPSRGPGQTVHTQSTDLIQWTGFETLIAPADGSGIGTGVAILKEPDGITPLVVDGQYWMVYFHGFSPGSMYLASTDATGDLLTWTTCCSTVPILTPTPGSWDANGLWTPSFTRVDDTYYIYYQGQSGTGAWTLGFAKGAAVSGGEPVRPDQVTWTKSASPVVSGTHGWDASGCCDPVLRRFDGTCYLFYTSLANTNGFCTSTSPEGPWAQYSGGGGGVGWVKGGSPTVTNGILSLGSGSYVKSPDTYSPGTALGFRARYYSRSGTNKWAGFMNGTTFPGLLVQASTYSSVYGLYLVAYASPTFYTASLGAPPGEFHVYEDAWVSSSLGRAFLDNATTPSGSITVAAAVPDGPLPVEFYNYNDGTNTLEVDWMYLRSLVEPEPTSSVGPEQIPVAVDEPPNRTLFSPARPTPFVSSTTLEFSLAARGEAELKIFGVDGRVVRTLVQGEQGAGVHRLAWDGRDDAGRRVPAGLYFARLTAGHERFTRTLIRLAH